MKITIFAANVSGDAKNCFYPNKMEVADPGKMQEAVKFDHVCAEYDNDYRSSENFRSSNVVVLDCDNDKTEDPAEWITPEKFEDLADDYNYVIVPSRHNWLEKNGKAPRPKFHVYFPIRDISNHTEYAALKESIFQKYPFFDPNALDAARFIFGADVDACIWHEGWMNIDEDILPTQRSGTAEYRGIIAEGTRNKTMSRFAGRVVVRYGDSEKAREIFYREAAKCDPPLPDEELATIWASATRFGQKVAQREGYIPPSEYNSAEFISLKPSDYSDLGEAKVLAREYGNELRYTDATDLLRYNGIYWQESKQMAVGAMQEFLDLQLEDAKDQLAAAKKALEESGVSEDDIRTGGKTLQKAVSGSAQVKLLMEYLSAMQYLSFVMKRRDYKYVIATLNMAKPMVLMDINELDSDENLLNTPAATFDLRKGLEGAQEHNPRDFITKCTIAPPGDKGQELWEDTVNKVFCGDLELIDYVQRIVGMAAIGAVKVEALIICFGDGANGKSTFWNTISRVLGSYSGTLSADALTVGCRRNVKPEMAELKGKRLIIAAELEEGMRLNTSLVKQLCSTDDIAAEKKYKDPFHYTPTHTLVLYTNHLPKVGANDDGIWRRLIVVPFNAKITGNDDIKNYSDFLVENAAPAVLSWIIEGAKKAIDSNFRIAPPTCVQNAIKAYRENNNWFGHFLDECCEVDKTYSQKSGELYQAYRAFCQRSGEYIRSSSDFATAVENAGFEKKKRSNGAYIFGLRLKAEEDDDLPL